MEAARRRIRLQREAPSEDDVNALEVRPGGSAIPAPKVL